jgi:hypothetical protein
MGKHPLFTFRSPLDRSLSYILWRFLRRLGFGARRLWRERSDEVNRQFKEFPDCGAADVGWIHVDIALHGPTPHNHGPHSIVPQCSRLLTFADPCW